MAGYADLPTTQYARSTGSGTLAIANNGTFEKIAVVDFEIQLKHNKIVTETTGGIWEDVSINVEFEGKFTTIAGSHKFWSLFMGLEGLTSSAESIYSGPGSGGEQIMTSGITQPSVPSLISVSISSTEAVSPDKIVIQGKDAFGNTVLEDFNYTGAETVNGCILFSQIDSITLPATLTPDHTINISSIAGVKSGKPTKIPKFVSHGFIKTQDGHVMGVQLNNVMILEKPRFSFQGKEEHVKEEIKFTVSNANNDVIIYELSPSQ